MAKDFSGARKIIAPLFAVLLALLALFAWNRFSPVTFSPSESAAGTTAHLPNNVYFGTPNSIAVLPFTRVMEAQQEAFWSDGFSRELHSLLTRTPGLQVTSWNSSFFFQDLEAPMKIIGERMQSTHLLTGEFQFSDEAVRVSVRLYDAKKDKELWSQVYHRGPEDLFKLQDEILASVAEEMKLGQRDKWPRAEAVDIEAWTFFLQGLFLQQQGSAEGLQGAEVAYRSALEIEPGYEMARVGLARVWLEREAGGDPQQSLVEKAREALVKTLQSRPELADAHGLLSYIRHNYDWDWAGALQAAERAIRLSPGDPEIMSTASLALFTLGQFDEAVKLLQASVRQDPLNLSRRLRLGLLQEFNGDYEQSLLSYRQIVGLNPEFPAVRAFRARVKIIQDKPGSALRESEQEVAPFWKRYSEILAYTALQRHEEAESLLERMIVEDGDLAAYQVSEILAFRGDVDASFEWLERAREQKDGGMREILGNHFLQNLHSDPRWQKLLERLSLPLDLTR